MTNVAQSIHAYGYEGTVEENVPVFELYRPRCTLCPWEGEEHDEMGWKAAEEEAVEHYQDFHGESDDEDEDEMERVEVE